MRTLANEILRLCEAPLVLADVGSAGGLGGDWRPHKKSLKVILFEPDKRSYKQLVRANDDESIIINAALGSQNKIANLYLTKKPQVSSTYKPNKEFLKNYGRADRFDIKRVTKVECKTLDSLYKSNEIPAPDFISMDVQGGELDVLRGGQECLSKSLGVRAEVAYAQVYENQPLEPIVHKYLLERGFEEILRIKIYWNSTKGPLNELVSGDNIYIKTTEDIINIIKTNENKRDVALRALAICANYGTKKRFSELLEVLGEFIYNDDLISIRGFFDNVAKEFKPVQSVDIRL